jgi:hypothetical protein
MPRLSQETHEGGEPFKETPYRVWSSCVLREQLSDKRLRFSDNQRRRLAVRARKLGRGVLHELATLVTPEPFS